MGYREVSLNLGCPSGTVVAKGKGAGFLAHPEELDRFLDTIFTGTDMKISVKTRLGLHESEEFGRILEIYNRYPISELIIHPRVRKDFTATPAGWRICPLRAAQLGSGEL
jgi:tRNA-dihydrouridine synthase